MAEPSSSLSLCASSLCVDPEPDAGPPLGSAAAAAFQQSNRGESPLPMVSDWDDAKFMLRDEREQTLRENDAMLSVLEKLDEFWFFENVFKWPRNGSSRSSETSQQVVRDLPLYLPPFQSLEMGHLESALEEARECGLQELPRVRFGKSPVYRGTEGGEPLALNSSDDAEIDESDCCGSLRELPTARNEFSSLQSMTAEESRSPSIARKEEEVAERDLKQAGETFEGNASSVEKLHDTSLTPSKADIVEPPNENLLPLALNSKNVHLAKPSRRRKQRRKRSGGILYSEHDEIRGFRELGFSFSQDKLTPRMISLFPGVKVEYGEEKNYPGLQCLTATQYHIRSYPAWWTILKPNSPLYNWQFPNPNQEGVDMKAHLKFWARAVASTVRQEC